MNIKGLNNMVIIYLILIITVLGTMLYQEKKRSKIYYNNYQQCLRALADTDPSLAEFLRR